MGSQAELARLGRERIMQLRQLDNRDLADYLEHSVSPNIPLAAVAIGLGRVLKWIDEQESSGREQ